MLISAFPHYFLYALFKHHAVLHAVILLSFILIQLTVTMEEVDMLLLRQ